MTREEAIQELRVVYANVEKVLSEIHADASRSQRWRNEKIDMYQRRLEALTFAIEALEDLGTKRSGVS